MSRINGENFDITKFRAEHPEFALYSETEILSILNNEASDIKLTESQENSILAFETGENDSGFSLDDSKEVEILQLLESRVKKVTADSIAAQKNNGGIGHLWHYIKNYFDIGDSSDDVDKAQIEDLNQIQGKSAKAAFETLTGVEFTPDNLEK